MNFLNRELGTICLLLLPLVAEATPPRALQRPHLITEAGHTRNDPFFWLRNIQDPAVLKYLKAENQYAEATLKHTEKLQQTLYKEIRSRVKEEDLSVPEKIGNYYYYTRTETGKQYVVHCRKKGNLEAKEEVVLDENGLAQGHNYFRIGVFEVSPDHRLLAYSTDTSGNEVYVLHVLNLTTGETLPDEINNTYYTFAWSNDNRTFFYDQLDAAKRPFKALKHELGTDVVKDPTIYEEKDERFFLTISKARSEKYLFINVESELTSEVRYLNADQPEGAFTLIQPREENLRYSVENHDDRFFIVTNENAKNFKLVTAPVATPGKENWKEVIPYDPRIMILEVSPFQEFLAISERANGLSAIQIYDLRTGESRAINFEEPTYDVELGQNAEFNTNVVRLNYTSFVTPASVVDYDMVSGQRELKKETPVLGYNKADYISERIFAKADDGAEIPVSLFYKKGFKRDGTAPLWLDGYGAYGVNNDVYFSNAQISLVDRGFVCAIAHIRGGGELGRTWYEDGKLLRKKNTFTDFIRATEFLIEQKYVFAGKVAISGGSAGGLLMGAVMNMRPDLFTTVIADVPFVDALNTMSDPTLPLTITEYEEWGNPEKTDYYDYMASYSPYDNIAEKRYPNLLVTAGLNDPRVSYWEPAKWVAKQRTLKHQNRVLVLRTNMGAGHGGDSGRFDRIKEVAREYAFAIDTMHSGKR